MAEEIDCTLLLFVATTTEKEELKAVALELGLGWQGATHRSLGRHYKMGDIGDYRVVAVQTRMGPFMQDGSAAKGIFFKRGTAATAIVQLGMAFGIDSEKQKRGDVLVSTSLVPYDRRNVLAHEGHYRHDYTPAARQMARESMVRLFHREAEKPGWPFNVHVGAILSGGAAISSTKFRNELRDGFPALTEPIVGGDMEAVGLVSVPPSDGEPAWVMVKGISDFAEDDRPADFPEHRKLACTNSARFVLTALLRAREN